MTESSESQQGSSTAARAVHTAQQPRSSAASHRGSTGAACTQKLAWHRPDRASSRSCATPVTAAKTEFVMYVFKLSALPLSSPQAPFGGCNLHCCVTVDGEAEAQRKEQPQAIQRQSPSNLKSFRKWTGLLLFLFFFYLGHFQKSVDLKVPSE